jgi:diaminopimelate epimerase
MTDGPTPIRLTKHHGLGNDFLVAIDPPRPLGGDDARRWCDRRLGIGADGLIEGVELPAATDPADDGRSPTTSWRMSLWNSDGSRAEISGNGIRCLGQAVADHLKLDRSVDHDLIIETDAGTRPLTVLARAASSVASTEDRVRVGMGKAVPGPALSDRLDEVASSAEVVVRSQIGVDIGNPHLVAFVESLGSADMAAVGPAIEADYPGGVNVHLVEVADANRLGLRVWERGAGVTQACGSGASAAAWAGVEAGLVSSPVTVDMPGGSATVEVEPGDQIFLIGPAVRVGEVIIDG